MPISPLKLDHACWRFYSADIPRDKMNCLVRLGNCFLRVVLMYQPSCLLPCCQDKPRELAKKTVIQPSETVHFVSWYTYDTIDSFNKISSPVAFVSGVEVAAAAAVEVSLKLVPIGRRGGVHPVPVELVDHRGRGHRSSVHHGRTQLERGEDGSKLQQTGR